MQTDVQSKRNQRERENKLKCAFAWLFKTNSSACLMCFLCEKVEIRRGRGVWPVEVYWDERERHNRFSFARKKEEWILLR